MSTPYCLKNELKTCFRQVITTTWDTMRACECGIPCEGTRYVSTDELHKLPVNKRAEIARKIWSAEEPKWRTTIPAGI